MKYIIASIIVGILMLACNSKTNRENSVGISPADSLLNKTETTASYSIISDSSKLIIIKRDGKSLPYKSYMQSFVDEELNASGNALGSRDIDGDGNPELVTSYYTGGAHCCDVNTILSRTAENEMTEVLDFTGGTTISKDTVTISFFEALGYFHTCYACGLDYPNEVGPLASFLFKNGKFTLVPYSKSLDENCETNIKTLVANGIPDKDAADESGFDNGTRKMIAYNIVAYYFNNQRDLAKAKSLFDKYYTHKDRETIWKDLSRSISNFDDDIKKGIRLN